MNLLPWDSGPIKSEQDFERLMLALDTYLFDSGYEPVQRPHLFSYCIGPNITGFRHPYPPESLADEAGFEGDVLIAKGQAWYKKMYGERIRELWLSGAFAVRLGNSTWRVNIPRSTGKCEYFIARNLNNIGYGGDGTALFRGRELVEAEFRPRINTLTLIEGMEQEFLLRLSDQQIEKFQQHFLEASVGINLLFNALQSNIEERPLRLFQSAYSCAQAAMDSLLGLRYHLAKWDTQQCIEKSLKGILLVAGCTFDKTHKLHHLASKLERCFAEQGTENAHLPTELLTEVECPISIRYNEEKISREEAFAAYHSALAYLANLALHPSVRAVFGGCLVQIKLYTEIAHESKEVPDV